jgi:diacylglycerol kinase family enzyme
MYYYIFESPKTAAQRTYFEKMRDVVREFGISGEITQASPARSPQELTQMAVEKNYSTIVAIGNDAHVNKIASEIIKLNPQFPVALGVVSTDPDSMLYERWGFKKPEEACETLKYRKLEKFDMGLVEPDHYFLTSIKIECKKPTRIVLEVDHWRAEAVIDRLEISGNLYILLERFFKESSAVKSAINWLVGKPTAFADRSIFKGRLIRIASSTPLPILIDNEIITKTPVSIYRKMHALNIITKRDKLIPVTHS